MGDVKKDVESMRRIHATFEDKIEISSDISGFIIDSFSQRIRKKHPRLSKAKFIGLLRQALYHGRKDNP